MALIDTKQKILQASLQLFNEYGIINVRLQQIADETGISVGNLAYHFNNKDAITESLIADVIISLDDLLKKCGKYTSFSDLDFFFEGFYELFHEHRFFSVDLLEIKRNFPSSYKLLVPVFSRVKLQLEKRVAFFVKQQLIQKPIGIKNLASNLWLIMFFMPAERHINEGHSDSHDLYRHRLWDYMQLYLTPKGTAEYKITVEPTF